MKTEFFAFLLIISTLSIAQKVEWISTTDKNPWVKEKSLTLNKVSERQNAVIEIDPEKTLQRMTGFGGCFNEFGYEALKDLTVNKQESTFKQLFSAEGANFQLNRLPVGASDYSLDFYSFDETRNDFEMDDFSIARDKNCLIPYVNRARKYCPEMRFFASPWCPPSWMKTNENYASISNPTYNKL